MKRILSSTLILKILLVMAIFNFNATLVNASTLPVNTSTDPSVNIANSKNVNATSLPTVKSNKFTSNSANISNDSVTISGVVTGLSDYSCIIISNEFGDNYIYENGNYSFSYPINAGNLKFEFNGDLYYNFLNIKEVDVKTEDINNLDIDVKGGILDYYVPTNTSKVADSYSYDFTLGNGLLQTNEVENYYVNLPYVNCYMDYSNYGGGFSSTFYAKAIPNKFLELYDHTINSIMELVIPFNERSNEFSITTKVNIPSNNSSVAPNNWSVLTLMADSNPVVEFRTRGSGKMNVRINGSTFSDNEDINIPIGDLNIYCTLIPEENCLLYSINDSELKMVRIEEGLNKINSVKYSTASGNRDLNIYNFNLTNSVDFEENNAANLYLADGSNLSKAGIFVTVPKINASEYDEVSLYASSKYTKGNAIAKHGLLLDKSEVLYNALEDKSVYVTPDEPFFGVECVEATKEYSVVAVLVVNGVSTISNVVRVG